MSDTITSSDSCIDQSATCVSVDSHTSEALSLGSLEIQKGVVGDFFSLSEQCYICKIWVQDCTPRTSFILEITNVYGRYLNIYTFVTK